MKTANLEPGREYQYEEVLERISKGSYTCATIKSAAGRDFPLIGVSDEQFALITRTAIASHIGLILSGSRVVGPRTHQRTLHPALMNGISLCAKGRAQSVNYPGVSGIRIEKTSIKEFGLDSPLTSDLSVLLVAECSAPSRRREIALSLARAFDKLGCSFPIRVFDCLHDRCFATEAEYVEFGCINFLLHDLPQGHDIGKESLRAAFTQLYAPVNLS